MVFYSQVILPKILQNKNKEVGWGNKMDSVLEDVLRQHGNDFKAAYHAVLTVYREKRTKAAEINRLSASVTPDGLPIAYKWVQEQAIKDTDELNKWAGYMQNLENFKKMKESVPERNNNGQTMQRTESQEDDLQV